MIQTKEFLFEEGIESWNEKTLSIAENVPYYVYKHYLDGVLFYIGKGQKGRCFEFDSRGPAWKNFVDGRESEVLVDIAKAFSNENEAYNFESNEIISCESKLLVNVTHNKKKVKKENSVTRPLVRNYVPKKVVPKTTLFKDPTYIIYGSALHDLELNQFNSAEIKTFMSLISQLNKDSLIGENLVVTVPFKVMRSIIDNKGVDSSQFKKRLNKFQELNLLTYKFVTKVVVEVTFSKEVTEKILSNDKGYTVLNVKEYMSFPGRYAIKLYMKISENRMKGEFSIKKEDLVNLVSPPPSYDEYETIRKNIIPPLQENSAYFPNLMFSNLVGNFLPEVCKFNFFKKRTTKMERTLARAGSDSILEVIDKYKY